MENITIKKIKGKAVTPTISEDKIGYTVYACVESETSLTVTKNRGRMISTGLIINVPEGYFCQIYPHDMIVKKHMRLSSSIGTYKPVTEDEELTVEIFNEDTDDHSLKHGSPICKIVFVPYVLPDLNIEEYKEEEKKQEVKIENNQFSKWA